MGAVGGANAIGNLVLPEVPYTPIPKTIARVFPDMETWNRQNHEALKRWREQLNAALAKVESV